MKSLIPDDKLTLEELEKHKDIALISDDVSSREELIESLMKYLKLSRKQRRYSDYYSVKLLAATSRICFLHCATGSSSNLRSP